MFGDINLSQESIRGNYNPGAGGWPTIRYFNAATGYEGKPYPKKTDKAMCEELGDQEYMQAYVEEMGGTSLCSVADHAGCTEKEVEFIEKWKTKPAADLEAQHTRLTAMKKDVKSMKPEVAKWLNQRLAVLTQLKAADAPPKEEL